MLWTRGGKILVDASGRIINCDQCPCDEIGDRVLLWTPDNAYDLGFPFYFSLVTLFQNLEIPIDTPTESLDYGTPAWTGDINDYRLIFWPIALSNPVWFATVFGGLWRGRILVTAEHNDGGTFQPSIDYVDSLSSITGINVVGAFRDNFVGGVEGPSHPDPLTNEGAITGLFHNTTSLVTGGTPLFDTLDSAEPFMAHNKVGETDYVVSGDQDDFSDLDFAVGPNNVFITNLYEVAI